MKTVFFLCALTSLVLAQEYEKGKIDMHGGKSDAYSNIGSHKNGSFRHNTMNLSNLLDKNTTKHSKKKTLEEK